MTVNPKEKKMLQEMWNKADEAGQDLPDGTYQFEITGARFHMTDKGKPQFKTKLKITGGAEDYLGEELEINDNVETAENMGWFKKKLRRLNIAAPEDFDEIVDGTIAEQMKGKVFEGQVKTKNDFMNVYVNRLLGEGKGSDETEDKEEKAADKPDFEEGDKVEWNGKKGEVVEILADGNTARVKKEDSDTIVRVPLNLLSKVEAEEAEETEEEEKPAKGKGKKDEEEEAEETEGGEFELPDADEVEEMKLPKVKEALEAIGIESDEVKSPRLVLKAFCTLADDADAKIELEEVSPLAEALGVKVTKGASFKDTLKALSKAVAKKLG